MGEGENRKGLRRKASADEMGWDEGCEKIWQRDRGGERGKEETTRKERVE